MDEAFVADRCEDFDAVGGVHRARREQPGGDRADHRRSGRRAARGRPPVRAGAERGDLLRPRRHRAQPGLDDGDGHGQPGDGHRQHRPRGRRREPAARPEQRAGLVRHGVVPARAARLPARVATTRCAQIFEKLWGTALLPEPGLAHPQHVRRRDRRHVPGAVRPGRGHRAVRPQHPARRGRAAARWSSSSCRTCSSTRPRSSPTCSCPGRRSWRRTARSPTPSAGSTGCAR